MTNSALVPVKTITAIWPANAPAVATIGDHQAQMAVASLGSQARDWNRDAVRPAPHASLYAADTAGRPRLGPAHRRESRRWAESLDNCPYCRTAAFAVRAQSFGNLARVEGRCQICGTRARRLLA